MNDGMDWIVAAIAVGAVGLTAMLMVGCGFDMESDDGDTVIVVVSNAVPDRPTISVRVGDGSPVMIGDGNDGSATVTITDDHSMRVGAETTAVEE